MHPKRPPRCLPLASQALSANVEQLAAHEEAVRGMLSTIFDNLAEVQGIHPEARKLTLQAAAGKSAVPFHPAAIAFYRSKGISV